MKRYLLLLLLITVPFVWAQEPGIPSYQDLQYPPLPQVRLPEVQQYTLPNGLRLYLVEDHELPLIDGFALVRTGNLFDPPDKVGLAGITGEVMRSGGTKDKTGDQIDEQLENIAASVEASIGETSGSVGFSCLKENIDEVLAVYKDVLTAPEFRQDKIDLSKTQSRSLISRRNDQAGGIAGREFAELVYGKDTPYGWRMEYEHLDNISREDLVAFHQRYFFPANVMLAIQGDFDPAGMKAKIEQLFADWRVQQAEVPPFPKVTAKPAPGVYFATKPDVNQTFIRIGHLGGLLNDPDYPALEVMSDILGGGFSSRLFRKIRTQLGYAYGIGSSWGATYDHPGLFRISGSTKSASTVATIQATLKEVERIRTEEVTDAELQGAKDKVLNSFVFLFDTPGKTLRRMVRYDYFGYPSDFIFKYQKAIQAVTKADVLRVAKTRLAPEKFTFVAVGNPKEFDQPLTALNLPVHEIDLTIPEPKKELATVDEASLAKGKQLLAKLQQAVGGAGKLAAVKDFTRVSEIEIHAPQGQMKASQKNMVLLPHSLRQELQAPFGTMISSYNGTSGWLSTPQGQQPMPPPVIKQVRDALSRVPFRLWLADRQEGWTVNAAADAVLEISHGQGRSTRIELDPASGLPLKQSYQTSQLTGAPAQLEVTLEDWRGVDGIQLPFKSTATRDGAVYQVITVQEYRLNTGLTAEELDRKP